MYRKLKIILQILLIKRIREINLHQSLTSVSYAQDSNAFELRVGGNGFPLLPHVDPFVLILRENNLKTNFIQNILILYILKNVDISEKRNRRFPQKTMMDG